MGVRRGCRLNSSCCAETASSSESLLEEPQKLRPKVKAEPSATCLWVVPAMLVWLSGDHRKGMCCDSSVNCAELGSPDTSRWAASTGISTHLAALAQQSGSKFRHCTSDHLNYIYNREALLSPSTQGPLTNGFKRETHVSWGKSSNTDGVNFHLQHQESLWPVQHRPLGTPNGLSPQLAATLLTASFNDHPTWLSPSWKPQR